MKREGLKIPGRTAVITGAASGIGRALAETLWAEGGNLALVDIDAPALDGLAASLSASRTGATVSVHVADVAERARMLEIPSEVIAAHGKVNLLFNNAGIAYEGAFLQTSLATWERVLRINLWGVVHGCHVFLPHMAKEDAAHIVNISSMFGYVGMPGQTAYCASKHAVEGFTGALREELRETNVGLTLVSPSSVATNIMASSEGDDPELMEHLANWYAKHAMAPQVAAQRIVGAVRKRQPRLLISPEAYLADYLKRVMPVTGNRLMCELIIRALGLEHMRKKRSEQWRRTIWEKTS